MIRPPHQLIVFMIVGLSLSSLASGQRPEKDSGAKVGDVPTVDFCDLTVHPERYVGKLVRVMASIVSWWESSYLYNVKCESSERKIHDALDCAGDAECELLGKNIYGVINHQQRPDKDQLASRAYVTLVGKLVGPSERGFGHLNWAKFEFRIKNVEAAAPMPSGIPYAKE